MKKIMLAAMAVISAAAVANAESHIDKSQPGHWEWQTPRSYGPRAPLPISHRVWVPDHQGQVTGDCTAAHPAGEACHATTKPKAG